MNLATLKKKSIKTKTIAIFATVFSAVVLPQIFHLLGIASGTGNAPGEIFLPMHLPVLAAGLLAGPVVGVISGILSPIISFAMTGMPTAMILPFMVVELAMYGFVAGAVRSLKAPSIVKLVSAQAAGRLARAAVIAFSVYVLGSELSVAAFLSTIVKGLPGLMIQWALIPLFVYRVEND